LSWSVDGRMYHDYAEYQAALRRKSEREAYERVGQSQAELRRYQQRLRQQEQDLAQAQGDLERQRDINERMRHEVRGLEREQQILASAQAQFEQESQAQFGQLRHHMQGMGDQLEQADRAHQEHVEATRKAFARAGEELRAGLDNARREREDGERRLTTAIQEVDRKVDLDRQARIKRQRDDLDQAREQMTIVESMLGEMTQQQLKPLSLEEDAKSVRTVLESAGRMLNAGKASVALSQAESAFSGVQDLRYKASKRRAELEATGAAVSDRVRAILDMTNSETLDEYFKFEKAELVGYLGHLSSRMPGRYQQYSRMEDDLREDERIIGRLEEEARTMLATCPTLGERVDNRKNKVTEFVRKIAARHGGSAGIDAQLARPDDPKSDLIVDCRFDRGVKVRIVAGIDGTFTANAAGYPTQAECERHSGEMVSMFQGEADLSGHRTLAHNPEQLPETAPAQSQESWRDLGSRLRDIGRSM
jgi:hypothetical protein